jgi:ABC-type lipoprotein release transport system permease subunit
MKLAFQLAYKNLMGAGLRTWLNVGVLSFAFIIILFYNGWIDGWNEQARKDTIEWEYAHGHVYHADYDPIDPFTITDAFGSMDHNPDQLTPVLIRHASLYPDGRMMSILVKGIDVNQNAIHLPTQLLAESTATIPAIIGERMASATKLEVGDEVLMRWRDMNGTFDAATITIVDVFENNVGSIDGGQVWVSINQLWEMTGMEGLATMYIANESYQHVDQAGWTYDSQESLLGELNEIIKMKKMSGSVMYLLLLAIALLAIFDTQVLSVFRRQKEIGTYIALGMTRQQVVGIFTVEGAMNSIFAAILAAIYGIPLLAFVAKKGIAVPMASQDIGISIAERLYPVFSLGLIITTVLLVVISATIVSFLPSRKIAKMDPVLALKGKVQ